MSSVEIPEKLQSWRFHDPKHYHACFRCGSANRLVTITLERDGIIYGFMFACGRCLLATGHGTQIVWRLKESALDEEEHNDGP